MESTNCSTTVKRCAVVTGANKGIGLEICRQLASDGVVVILTARDEKRGIEAVENLKASGLSDVVFHQLDVKEQASIATCAKFIETHFGKLDILVNNAGDAGLVINCEVFRAFALAGNAVSDENADLLKDILKQTYEKAEECVKTNYYGTKGVTEALLPLLQLSQSARIVNISSFYGQLKFINNEKAKAVLENVNDLTEEKLDEVLQWFLRDFKEHKLDANGWPKIVSAYKVSKAAVNAYTRLIAKKFPQLHINCIHPGTVKTEMTCNLGKLTPQEGARGPVMLSLLHESGPTGLFFEEMEVSSF